MPMVDVVLQHHITARALHEAQLSTGSAEYGQRLHASNAKTVGSDEGSKLQIHLTTVPSLRDQEWLRVSTG